MKEMDFLNFNDDVRHYGNFKKMAGKRAGFQKMEEIGSKNVKN